MDYATLKSDVLSFSQRSDAQTVAAIPMCVRYATAAINGALLAQGIRAPEMESRDTRSLDAEYTLLPADFLEIRSVMDGSSRELRYLPNQQLDSIEASGTIPNPPIYTIEDMQLRVYPAPSAAAPLAVVINYYEKVADLVGDSDTNWVLELAPDAYLYGALSHLRMWLQDPDGAALARGLFDQALSGIKRRKPHATGVATARGTDVPVTHHAFDIVRGW